MTKANPKHPPFEYSEIERLKAHVHGLTVMCPFSLDNPPECPLCQVRTMTPHERFAWVESLTAKEIEETLSAHSRCMHKKVAAEMEG